MKLFRWRFAVLAVTLNAAFASVATATLLPNIGGDRVDTLPKGRFFLSAVQYYTEINRRFDRGGQSVRVEDNFRRGITWNQIARDDRYRSEQFAGLLQAQGINLNDNAGSFEGHFKGDLRATVPIIGYGITDRVGIFVAAPVLNFRAEARVAYVASPSAKDLIPKLEAKDLSATAQEFATSLNNGFGDQLAKNGYDFHQSTDESMLGDIQIVTPITFFDPAIVNTLPWRFALQPMLSIPTGRTADPKDLYGIASGTGRFTPGVRGVGCYDTLKRVSFIGSVGMSYPLPAKQGRRLPVEGSDELNGDYDPETKLTGGFTYVAQLDVKYQISRSWSGRIGVQHQESLPTNHSGDQHPDYRYDYLDKLSHERLESIHAAVEFFSLKAFLDRDFPIPIQGLIGAALPLGGKNSIADPIVMGQLALFF